MKKILAVLAVMSLVGMRVAMAETISAPTVNAQAVVSNTMTISVDLRRDVSGFPDIANDTAMNFGTLVPNNGVLIASEGIMAFILANSHSLPYTVTSNVATTLTNGSKTIPSGAFVINNAYAAVDNGGAANEGTITFPSGSAVGNRTIYTSGGTHSQRVVQAHYTISADPLLGASAFVPLDQAGGTYTTNVVISVTR